MARKQYNRYSVFYQSLFPIYTFYDKYNMHNMQEYFLYDISFMIYSVCSVYSRNFLRHNIG